MSGLLFSTNEYSAYNCFVFSLAVKRMPTKYYQLGTLTKTAFIAVLMTFFFSCFCVKHFVHCPLSSQTAEVLLPCLGFH